jgi:phosphoribosylformimino-5-aminoimidazole carboxamide ribonucleotide (ProFAR) isomerase
MKTRALIPSDIPRLKEIHEEFFADQFSFPDFMNGFLAAFVVTDNDDNIIVGGGVRGIVESIIITDIDASRIKVGRALVEAFRASKYICQKFGQPHLHAFVQNYSYEQHLRIRGFTSIKGSALVLDIKDG